ncbi:Cu(I)/Ag(I) efflux RND transporter outer membrane protein [Yersinia pekkanenii]|uniref:Outer membrane efflux lipoprotein n=1 Tax=Yersinia pekkanenii TaxID=1288385 RepID=A0A0T9Q1C5_9GAMM|nr:Cu(I)/Ag(I) efflux RND transporter outer membrane protein [Yersinia pekkanenii]CNH91328.1 outer membrane efflux lipoprotein [Yersinia pekkanenii]CRY67745.1 outer membrane efflux lipoprotein [Yersinia pekkanenii]
MFKIKVLTLSALFALTGCTSLAPDYQRPALPVPQQFSVSHNELIPSTGIQDVGWRTFFSDAQVKVLINEALQHNRDLQLATLKVAQARAQYNVTDADRYPQLNASSNITYTGGLNSESKSTNQYGIGMGLIFDLDFFGRLKNMSEADRQNYFASQQAQRSVHILLVSSVSQSYFNQRLAYHQLLVAKQTLENYQRSYSFVEQQLQTGRTTLLALEQARGVIETTQSEIFKREGELAQANHALQLLLGKYTVLPDDNLQSANSLDVVKLPSNLSSEILLQRPDILAAEHVLMAANANIGAARAAFFPSISLTGNLTGSSTELSSLFNTASGMWSFVPKIEIPIFNAGRNKANLTLAEISQQQSVLEYEKKIQNAFKEVSDALSLRNSIQLQIEAQKRYFMSLQITVLRANILFSNGVVSYIEVLDAERSLFSTQQSILDLKYAQQVNEVNLFTALGGGWVE